MWLSLLFGFTGLVFIASTLSAFHHLRWVWRLPALSNEAGAAGLPRCSVVVAARDEEERIEASLRRLLAQQGVSLEIIVVDDRSTDGTGEVVRRLADEDARVRSLRVDTLPENWIGKCHACHLGAEAATGEWILFTDADCWLQPDVFARALQTAEVEEADHVTLTPGVAPQTVAAQAWHLLFLIGVSNWISGVNRDRPKSHIGLGAFNLVRGEAYRQCGGYEALRLSVVDDMCLGLLLRRAGFRTRAYIGGDDAECHWGTTATNMIKIMEKNYFAILNYRVTLALGGGLCGLGLWSAAILGPFTGTLAGGLAGCGLLTVAFPASLISRRLRWPLRGAAAAPFVYPLLFYAVLNSTFVTLRQGGVKWRDTFYPLPLLRKEGVR